MELILAGIASYLESLSAASPKIMAALAIAYSIGFVAKLVTGSIEAFILDSASKEDDAKLASFKGSQGGKALFFVLDLLVRFKKPATK